MYHIGHVLKVIKKDKETISSDNLVQAMVEMWDEIRFILKVEDSIAEHIKIGDYAIVDYNPIITNGPSPPKQVIVKLLRGKAGKEIWDEFRKYKTKMEEMKKTRELEGNPYAR